MNFYKQLLFLLLFLPGSARLLKAQELSIGDYLPDYTFNSVFRYEQSSLSLSDFRNKVLILDLWRTTCGHCINSFTHFDSLVQQFPGQVAALAITSENRADINRFLTTNGYAKATKLPVVTNDTVLAGKRFPFIYIPHVVVVDSKGRIAAITAPELVTAKAIADLLAGKRIALPLKKEITDFNYEVPVFTEGSGRNVHALVYSSTITRGLPGVLQLSDTDTSGNRFFYKAYNMTIPDLYAQAYHFFLTPNRLILKTRDSARFFASGSEDAEAQTQNLWVYNLILPKSKGHPEHYAIQDFNRFFGTHGYTEKRQVNCLVLVRTGKDERWRAKGKEGYYTDSAGMMVMHNITVSNICTVWDMSFTRPVINESGLSNEPADLVVPDTADDLPLFRKKLQQYGLDLVPQIRTVNMLVIEDEEDN